MFRAIFVYRSSLDGFASSHRYECTRSTLHDAIEFITIIADRLDENHELSYINIQYVSDDGYESGMEW